MLIILYIPANCTSELQPLDVEFNGPFKKKVKAEAATWLAKEVASAIQRGAPPSEVHVSTGKRALVRPFCSWLHVTFNWAASQHEMLARAWSRSQISVAWTLDLDKRAKLLAEASVLYQHKTLWNASAKEVPLLADVLDLVQDNEEEEEEEEPDAWRTRRKRKRRKATTTTSIWLVSWRTMRT